MDFYVVGEIHDHCWDLNYLARKVAAQDVVRMWVRKYTTETEDGKVFTAWGERFEHVWFQILSFEVRRSDSGYVIEMGGIIVNATGRAEGLRQADSVRILWGCCGEGKPIGVILGASQSKVVDPEAVTLHGDVEGKVKVLFDATVIDDNGAYYHYHESGFGEVICTRSVQIVELPLFTANDAAMTDNELIEAGFPKDLIEAKSLRESLCL